VSGCKFAQKQRHELCNAALAKSHFMAPQRAIAAQWAATKEDAKFFTLFAKLKKQ
jgi:hypothetical protein